MSVNVCVCRVFSLRGSDIWGLGVNCQSISMGFRSYLDVWGMIFRQDGVVSDIGDGLNWI